ncbi:MAG: SDR family NAD(P)-dependent oxidoreductase, partial [Candidatus Dormibacteria bacterium]
MAREASDARSEPLAKALIVGANRGIGLGLVEAFAEKGWAVLATYRSEASAGELRALAAASDHVALEQVDIAEKASAEALRARLKGETFDLLFVNAGMGGPAANPRTVERDMVANLFETNAVGPVRLAELLARQVTPQTGV